MTMNVDGVDADRKFVHDMKNMLGIIIGYSSLLLDDMTADDPRRADVDEIRKAGEDAVALLDGLNTDETRTT
jgi:signal transduction histidine kinase